MVTFRIESHDVLPKAEIVEVWVDNKMVACIYPQEPNGIRVISKHLCCDPHLESLPWLQAHDGVTEFVAPPCIMRFDFQQ